MIGEPTAGVLIFGHRSTERSKKGLSTSAANASLKRRLDAAGLNMGETVHGFKRGVVQDELEMGTSEAKVSQIVATKTIDIVRRYGDCGAHLK